MNTWYGLRGMVQAELTGADPMQSLQIINGQHIQLFQVEWCDELTVRFLCTAGDKKTISRICAKRGDLLVFWGESRWSTLRKWIVTRPVLSGCFLIFFLFTMILPTRVLFFRVEGNKDIASRQILEAAEACGIHFGVSRRTVRSEKMKNALLSAMPQLKWAGINTVGCTAVISVQERNPEPEKSAFEGVSSIIAGQDGYITSCTVTRGTGMCMPGQVVQKGQLLISGYTDCGILIQVTQAQGEIYAETNRQIYVVTPSEMTEAVSNGKSVKRFGLRIGKKQINLWKGSGISPVTCGRMYEEYSITLPGGFSLPICLTVETLTHRKTAFFDIPPEKILAQMNQFAQAQIVQSMIAGRILHDETVFLEQEDICILKGNFRCSEMIGRVITEEIGEANVKTD